MSVHEIADQLRGEVEQRAKWLRGLSEKVVIARPSPERWTIKEVVGHLIDSAANNHQRFVRAQFVDELVFPKYEQRQWVDAQHYDELEWSELVELWRRYNLHLVHVIGRVDPAKRGVRCVIGDYPPVTLEFLIVDYLQHLRHHLEKIRERVGG